MQIIVPPMPTGLNTSFLSNVGLAQAHGCSGPPAMVVATRDSVPVYGPTNIGAKTCSQDTSFGGLPIVPSADGSVHIYR